MKNRACKDEKRGGLRLHIPLDSKSNFSFDFETFCFLTNSTVLQSLKTCSRQMNCNLHSLAIFSLHKMCCSCPAFSIVLRCYTCLRKAYLSRFSLLLMHKCHTFSENTAPDTLFPMSIQLFQFSVLNSVLVSLVIFSYLAIQIYVLFNPEVSLFLRYLQLLRDVTVCYTLHLFQVLLFPPFLTNPSLLHRKSRSSGIVSNIYATPAPARSSPHPPHPLAILLILFNTGSCSSPPLAQSLVSLNPGSLSFSPTSLPSPLPSSSIPSFLCSSATSKQPLNVH